MNETMVWKCEQWFAGEMQEAQMFLSESRAREYARRLAGVAPDLMLKVEPMPIQHVWN
jgi:hypothetical protein